MLVLAPAKLRYVSCSAGHSKSNGARFGSSLIMSKKALFVGPQISEIGVGWYVPQPLTKTTKPRVQMVCLSTERGKQAKQMVSNRRASRGQVFAEGNLVWAQFAAVRPASATALRLSTGSAAPRRDVSDRRVNSYVPHAQRDSEGRPLTEHRPTKAQPSTSRTVRDTLRHMSGAVTPSRLYRDTRRGDRWIGEVDHVTVGPMSTAASPTSMSDGSRLRVRWMAALPLRGDF